MPQKINQGTVLLRPSHDHDIVPATKKPQQAFGNDD